MPDRPRHSSRQVNWWIASTRGEICSIKSLSRISRQQGIAEPAAANRNLPHKIESRRTGSIPRIQNRRPSRLSIGKMKRVVNVDRIKPTTARFKKLIMLTQAV